MQEVKVGCHSVAKRHCPIGPIYTLYRVVEMNVDSLLLCQVEKRITELLARREHHRSRGAKMYVRLYFLFPPGFFT